MERSWSDPTVEGMQLEHVGMESGDVHVQMRETRNRSTYQQQLQL